MTNLATDNVRADSSTGEAFLQVGIVGCGLMGKRRAQFIKAAQSEDVLIVADVDAERANALAAEIGCEATGTWQDVVANDDVDVVVVSVPNKYMQPVVVAALEAGKHVLCEKPPGRNASEAAAMAEAARRNGRLLKIGFNKRYHPAVWKTHEMFSTGVIGRPMYVRAIFGHGARPGYEEEWYASADVAGGGALLDIGVHLVDLCRWFLGEFADVFSTNITSFWDFSYYPSGEQLEDNAFAVMRTPEGQVAHIHASLTQWKSRFSFEAFGEDGYIQLEGLGGHYGTATLTIGRRRPESGPPILETIVIDGPDNSLQVEWEEFVEAVRSGQQPLANGDDGVQTMRLIAALYESAHSGRIVEL